SEITSSASGQSGTFLREVCGAASFAAPSLLDRSFFELTSDSATDEPKAAGFSTTDAATATVFSVIAAISFSHFLNDLMQALLPAIYPMLKDNYGLTFGQVGLLTLTFQFTASLLQPVVGIYSDR